MVSSSVFLIVLWSTCYCFARFSRSEPSATWPRKLQEPSLNELLSMDSELSRFMEVLNQISNESFLTMMSAAPYTLFIPMNQAFDGLSEAETSYLSQLINEPSWGLHLQNWVENHFTYSAFFQIENITMSPTEVFMWNGESTFAQEIEFTGSEVLWNSAWTRAVGIMNSSQPISGTSGDGSLAYKLDGFLAPQFYNASILDLGSIYPEYSHITDLLKLNWDYFFSDLTAGFTILAPSSDAWMALGPERLQFLTDPINSNELERLLYRHIILTVQPTTLLRNGQTLDTMGGTPLTVTVAPAIDLVSDVTVSFDSAFVTQPNILAHNGILHEIDRVLDVPPLSTAPTTIPPIPQTFTSSPSKSPVLPPTLSPFVSLKTLLPSFVQTTPFKNSFLDGDADLSHFTAALERTGLKAELESATNLYTIFAPSNEAIETFDQIYWKKLLSPTWASHLRNLLELHIIDNSIIFAVDLKDGVTFTARNNETVSIVSSNRANIGLAVRDSTNVSKVTAFDYSTEFGLLHKINSVLLPAFFVTNFQGALASGLEILFDLLSRSGLGDSLNGTSEWTLLSPTNDAFYALGVETLDRLIDPVNVGFLREMMTTHMVNAVYPLELLVDGLSLASYGGRAITVSLVGSEIQLNGTTILKGNVLVKNGIVHTIDQVLGTYDFTSMSITEDSESDGDMRIEASSSATERTKFSQVPLDIIFAALLVAFSLKW